MGRKDETKPTSENFLLFGKNKVFFFLCKYCGQVGKSGTVTLGWLVTPAPVILPWQLPSSENIVKIQIGEMFVGTSSKSIQDSFVQN